ncbi:MAG TPA: alpha/beta hydrolase [Burkholderiales bacterium]|nr:alpha/beta hydrolase [Burkholderiales bacterium]
MQTWTAHRASQKLNEVIAMRDFPADVEYSERGEGPALLLLPGSFGTGSGWKDVTDRLARSHRIVTTSLLGYGATAERRPLGNATMRQQTEVIDRILERIGEPAHVVGHSFGGLAALAHAIEGAIKPASLMLVEANPIGLLKTSGETDLFAMFSAMTRDYFAEFEGGRPDAARHVIDFYGGEGTFAAFPAKVRDYVIKTTPANIRDWSSGTPFEPPLSAYRQIAVTTLVVRGGDGHPAMMRIAEILAEVIPHGRLETVAGGSHFLPATNPAELARLLDVHVEAGIA